MSDKEFIKLVGFLNPTYILPSRQKNSKMMILEMKEIINKVEKLTLTTDCWTSVQNEPYLAITANFIDNGESKNALISCSILKGDHRGEKLAAEIKEIIEFLNIKEKIMIAISNVLPNMD